MLIYVFYILFAFIFLAIIGGLVLTFLPSEAVSKLEKKISGQGREKSGHSDTEEPQK